MTQGSKYVMGGIDAATESDRLGLLESARDPGTIGRLALPGGRRGTRLDRPLAR